MVDLGGLITEQRNKSTLALDEMSSLEIIEIMNQEDKKVIEAVKKELLHIAKVIEWTTESLRKNARIIYTGAGTSGRIGILDAVECPPTFGVSYEQVVGLIAGGDSAFVKAVEGAEDSQVLGQQDLEKLKLTKEDTVIGLAASGRTPYVLGALKYAGQQGCHTAAISCNKNTPISQEAECAIELLTGAEVLTGSTRLKAGTAEKMVLNMISTVSMIGVGKTYQNLMVDVRQTNEKLVTRAENIVMEATGCNREMAKRNLKLADGEAKLAITGMLLNCNVSSAREQLEAAGGKISRVIKKKQ